MARPAILLRIIASALLVFGTNAQPWKAAARHLQQQRAQSLLSTSWTSSTFPNPTRDVDRCNRQGVKSWVCDPDGVISYNTANVVEAVLQDIQAGKSPYKLAPCGALGKQGFQVAVALLRKMQIDDEKPADTARAFAKGVHGRWGVGLRECNNGVVLFLAIDDRQVYISTGRGARKALSDSQAAIIIDRMKPALRATDYDAAVERAVREIGMTLAGASFVEPRDWVTTLYAAGVGAFVVWVFASGIRKSMARRREQRTVQSLLERLREEQRDATTNHRYPATSCPICFDPLAAPGTAEAPSTAAGQQGEEHAPLLQHQHVPGGGPESPTKGPLALPCGHVFCEPCIDEWLTSHTTCPICRIALGSGSDGNDGPAPPPARPPSTPSGSDHPPPWRRRRQWPPPPRCWSQDVYMDEYTFRLNRLHMRFPSLVTDTVVADLLMQARRGEVMNWEETLRRDMADRAARDALAQRGQYGTNMSFGEGGGGGGGGAGGSW